MAYTDRFPIVTNFFESQLVADCDAGATTLRLADVGKLPTIIVGRDYVPLILRDAVGVREIVYVEAVDANAGTVQVQRGQEGTVGAAWNVGAYVYCSMTAESLQRMRVNGFAPMVDPAGGRPAITRTSATALSITGDFTSQLEVGMAVRVLSGSNIVAPIDATIGAIFVGSVSFSGGKTSVGLQNVSLPSVVSGIDLGLSTASAPLYHPDTPLGDGATITLDGGVLKIAESFMQAQATRDAAQDSAITTAQTTANSAKTAASNAQTSANNAQKSADAKLPLDGDKSFTLRGTNTSYVFSVNNTATALQIAAKNSEGVTRCVFFLNAESGRISARVYNDSGESKDFYLNPDSWKAVWAGSAIVTEDAGKAYSTARTPDVREVNFTGTSYTTPSGGTWSVLVVASDGSEAAGWNGVAGGTKLQTVGSKTWRGIISRTA